MAVYALLVGIDAYQADIPDLQGAVNDIDHVDGFLKVRFPDERGLHTKVLRNGEATRAAVIEAFRTHLTQAGPGDAALFWFSGHGSQVPVAGTDFARSEPSQFLQTIVCADSRHEEVPDLLDKEINILISGITASGAHMTAVFDCCHSQGVTRWPRNPELLTPHAPALKVRWAAPTQEMPPAHLLLPELAGYRAPVTDDHVSLAACQSHQVAYEIPVPDGRHRGVFSLMLLRYLNEQRLSYRELIARARCLVETERPDQWPAMSPVLGPLAGQAFLGGQATVAETVLMMRRMGDGWYVDAGACHGLELGTPENPTLLGLYDDEERRQVRVVRVDPDRSRVEPIGWEPKDADDNHPVVITQIPVPLARVLFDLETDTPEDRRTMALAAEALATAGPDLGPSPHLTVLAAESPTEIPELRVTAVGRGCAVIRDSNGAPLDSPQPCGNDSEALEMVRRVEHVVRWRRMLTLDNPRPSRLSGRIAIDVVAARPGEDFDLRDRAPMTPDGSETINVSYQRRGELWLPPDGVFIRLRNQSQSRLFCVVLDMTDRFRLHPYLFPGDWVGPGTAYVQDGRRIDMFLPADQTPEPGTKVVDWLKVLVAETPIDASQFVLPHLGMPLPPEEQFRIHTAKAAHQGKHGSGVHSVIDRLGFTAMRRDAGLASSVTGDWTTVTVKVVTSVPDEKQED